MADAVRAAVLVRVSTEKVEQSDSPENQLAYCREELRRTGWTDSGLVYQDELTGALVLERPDVRRLLADARARRFEAVLLKSITRLGRNTLGLLHLKRHMDDLGIELVSLQDGYRSLRDPELIFLVHADRAQHGRIEISNNVRNAMRQKALRGLWTNGRVPFGYRRKGRNHLEPHPETSPVVQRIFDLRCQGYGIGRIAQHVNEVLHVPAPAWWQGRERRRRLSELAEHDERWAVRLQAEERRAWAPPLWSAKTVGALLRNPAYRGQLRYYRSYWRISVSGKKRLEARPPGEWIDIPVAPLVPAATWEAAQQVRLRRLAGRAPAAPYLLTGIVRCAACGGAMHGAGGRGRRAYYYCQNRRERHACSAPGLRATELEQAVIRAVAGAIAQLPAPAPAQRRPQQKSADALAGALAARLQDLQGARFYRREEHRKGRLAEAELDTELAYIARLESDLRAELAAVSAAAARPAPAGEQETMRRAIALLQEPALGRTDLRLLLQAAVARVTAGADGATVCLRFAPPP